MFKYFTIYENNLVYLINCICFFSQRLKLMKTHALFFSTFLISHKFLWILSLFNISSFISHNLSFLFHPVFSKIGFKNVSVDTYHFPYLKNSSCFMNHSSKWFHAKSEVFHTHLISDKISFQHLQILIINMVSIHPNVSRHLIPPVYSTVRSTYASSAMP